MKFFRRRKDEIDRELKQIESHLMETLQPVMVRPEFVSGLHAKLTAREIQVSTSRFPQKFSNGLIVVGGVAGSILMLIASIRGILSIAGVVRLLIQHIAKNTQQQTTPA